VLCHSSPGGCWNFELHCYNCYLALPSSFVHSVHFSLLFVSQIFFFCVLLCVFFQDMREDSGCLGVLCPIYVGVHFASGHRVYDLGF
jgi:hypothetical protein